MRNQYIVKGKTTTVFVEAPPDYEDGGFIDIIIDTDDLERVKSFPGSWYSFRHKHNDKIYVRGSKQQHIPPGFTSSQPLLHRVIAKPTRGENVTFVDGNSFNCCKKNLVNIPIGQVYKPHLDPYRLPIVQGVHWRKDKQRFEVKAYYDRKGYYLGLYALEDWEAANKAVSVFREIGPEEYFKRYKKGATNFESDRDSTTH